VPATHDDFLRAIPFEVDNDMWRIDAPVVAISGVDQQLPLAVEYVDRVVRGDELVAAVPIEVRDHG
jgi:hypothetical protein